MADATSALLQLPVRKVTCLEDRAEVVRQGECELAPGLNRLRVEGVSVLAVDRSLRVEVEGGRLLGATLARRWKEVPRGGLPQDASELRKRADALGKEAAALADELAALQRRRELIAAARADVVRDINEWTGAGRAVVSKWKERLAALSAEGSAADQAATQAADRARVLKRELVAAKEALAASELPERTTEAALEIVVDSTGGKARLSATYLLPCALWRPAYRATLVPGGKVGFEAFAVVWQATGEAWDDVQLAFSTARPTLGTRPPELHDDWLTTRPKLAEEKRVVDVQLREQDIQTTGEGGKVQAQELPGLDDGGEARLLPAPAPARIPSDGQPHRVPLSSFEAPAVLEWLCVPLVSPRVNLVARFPNQAPHVLLAGPVDLLRHGGFSGRTRLGFYGQGETVVLGFGSEDGARAVREATSKTEEARLTGRRTTQNEIVTWLVNASPAALDVVVEERIPVSEVKEVEVRVVEKESRPVPEAVSPDGIARFKVQVPANGRKELKFVWELQAAAKVAGV